MKKKDKELFADYKNRIQHFIFVSECFIFDAHYSYIDNHCVVFVEDDGFEVGDIVCILSASTGSEYIGPIEKLVPLTNHFDANLFVAVHSRSLIKNTTKDRLTNTPETNRNAEVFCAPKKSEFELETME